ncbi:MAG: ABC transporter substrate-binding protein [Ruminococcaceae bacterium]|nr:ABC transporter substrate-binding protein [Oscillospiraceae bacterium]
MKKSIAMLLALVMVFGLCACGGTANQEAAKEEPAAAPAAPVEKAEVELEGTEVAGETDDGSVSGRTDLNLAMATVLGTNDIHQNSQINGELLMWNVYEGLFFVTDTGELEPRLAESYEVAEDNKTYTVKLREGVKFHNGEEFTSADVVHSYERVRNYPTHAAIYEYIESVEAVDDYTVTIVATDTVARFMANICKIKIVSKTDAEKFGEDAGIDLEHTMAGTGPYYFTEFKPDSSIKLAAFADYYMGEAAIKEVNYKVMTDASTILAALETGEVDFASTTTANIPVIEANESLQAICNPSTHNSYIKFDWMENEALSNKLVRQAICYALNKEEIMYGCYDGYGDIAENFAREGLIFGATTEDVTVYDYNPEKAKELLAEAGYADGVDIGTLWACGQLYFGQGAQIMEQQLAAVGITVKCELLEQKTVEGAIFRGEADWDMAFHGGAMTVDSDAFYDWMFNPVAGTYVGKGSGGQLFDINPRLVELGEAAKVELDAEKRAELYKEFWQIAQDEAYVISIFHRYNAYGANKLLNVKLYTTYYYLYDWSWQ